MNMYGAPYHSRLSNKTVFKMFCWLMELNKAFCYSIFACWFVEGVAVVGFFSGGGVGGEGGGVCFVSWYVGGGRFCFWFKDLKKNCDTLDRFNGVSVQVNNFQFLKHKQ